MEHEEGATLLSLPPEVLSLLALSFLSFRDLGRVASISKAFHEPLNDAWRQYYYKYFAARGAVSSLDSTCGHLVSRCPLLFYFP